jgi:hypothetical protein
VDFLTPDALEVPRVAAGEPKSWSCSKPPCAGQALKDMSLTLTGRHWTGGPRLRCSWVITRKRTMVKELVRYLLENMYLDFQGEISLETVRQFLRSDDSREARQLLQKLIEDRGVDELLLTLADVLKDHLRSGVSEEVVREQLVLYSES